MNLIFQKSASGRLWKNLTCFMGDFLCSLFQLARQYCVTLSTGSLPPAALVVLSSLLLAFLWNCGCSTASLWFFPQRLPLKSRLASYTIFFRCSLYFFLIRGNMKTDVPHGLFHPKVSQQTSACPPPSHSPSLTFLICSGSHIGREGN